MFERVKSVCVYLLDLSQKAKRAKEERQEDCRVREKYLYLCGDDQSALIPFQSLARITRNTARLGRKYW